VSPQPGYPFQTCAAFATSQGSTPAFGGRQGAWTAYSVDLTGAIPLAARWTIAWEFASGPSGGKAGFFIDDVMVVGQ
jgi:hypothetical protein